MKNAHMSKIIAIFGVITFLILLGCAEESGQYSSSVISPGDYDIIFVGVVDQDVVFHHKEHSDRFSGECFQCHYCGDVLGETLWNCRTCHAPQDPEELCDEDIYHGCTYTQCYNCHEVLGNNPGLGCGDCHTPDPLNEVPTAGSVAITGTANVNSTLTGSYVYDDTEGDQESGSTFKWYRCDDTSGTNDIQISGATTTTYMPVTADEGKYLKFEVTPAAASGNSPGSPATSSAVGPIDPDPANQVPTASGVDFNGDLWVDATLTGTYTYNDTEGDLESGTTFKWYRNGAEISGAVSQTHTLVTADQGQLIKFEVTPASATGNTPGSSEQSAEKGPIVANPGDEYPYADNVAITGDLWVTATLTGTYDYHDAENDPESGSTFKWYRNDVEISGEISITYTLVPADQGQLIKFEVTPAAATGNSPGSPVQSSAYGPIGPDPLNQAPTATVLSGILVSSLANQDANGVYQITDQTIFDGVTISVDGTLNGKPIYKHELNDYWIAWNAGCVHRWRISADTNQTGSDAEAVTKDINGCGYLSPMGTWLPVYCGRGAVLSLNGGIDGQPFVNWTLTGSYIYSDAERDTESGSTFKWYRYDDASGTNEQEISGAISTTYTITSDDIGKYLTFEVTPAAATGNSPGDSATSNYAGIGPIVCIPGYYTVTGAGTVSCDGDYYFEGFVGDGSPYYKKSGEEFYLLRCGMYDEWKITDSSDNWGESCPAYYGSTTGSASIPSEGQYDLHYNLIPGTVGPGPTVTASNGCASP